MGSKKSSSATLHDLTPLLEDLLEDVVDGVLSKDEQEEVKQEMFQFVYQSYSTAKENVFVV